MDLFAPPAETIEMLGEQCDRLGLVATVYNPPLRNASVGQTGPLRELSIRWDATEGGSLPILLHEPVEIAQWLWSDLPMVELGWVLVWLGRSHRDSDRCSLEKTVIAAKSDYMVDELVKENPHSLENFTRLTRPLKRRLRHPMLVRNVVYGGERAYHIYYSEQAAALAAEGCELVQFGVANLRFYPHPGDSKK